MAEPKAPTNFNPAELIKRVEDTEKRLQTKDAEIQVYKMLMAQMEEELAQAKKYKALQDKQVQDVDSIKAESEKTLTKAKSLIFERTKIIKNQELQIEAFGQQIDSLKEVVRITKELLEIRNMEIKQLENKISAIEGKMKAEQERYDLMHKKLENMIRHNGELKREYETQLCLFSALRERYSERELARDVVDELRGAKEENNNQGQESTMSETKEETVKDENISSIKEDELSVIKENNNEARTKLNSLIDTRNKLDNILTELESTLSQKKNEDEQQNENTENDTPAIEKSETVQVINDVSEKQENVDGTLQKETVQTITNPNEKQENVDGTLSQKINEDEQQNENTENATTATEKSETIQVINNVNEKQENVDGTPVEMVNQQQTPESIQSIESKMENKDKPEIIESTNTQNTGIKNPAVVSVVGDETKTNALPEENNTDNNKEQVEVSKAFNNTDVDTEKQLITNTVKNELDLQPKQENKQNIPATTEAQNDKIADVTSDVNTAISSLETALGLTNNTPSSDKPEGENLLKISSSTQEK